VPPLCVLCNTWRRRKPITRNMGIAIVCAGVRTACTPFSPGRCTCAMLCYATLCYATL
jgi:hypothetical protein